MPGRKYSAGSSYRYGFNGKENDNDVKNLEGGQQDYGMRIYDPRVGKFLSVDPLTSSYPWYSPYQFAGNKPILSVDLDGLEESSASTYVYHPPLPAYRPTFQGVISISDATSQTVHKSFEGDFSKLAKWDPTKLSLAIVNSLVGGNEGTYSSRLYIANTGTKSQISKSWKGVDNVYYSQYSYTLINNGIIEHGTFEVPIAKKQVSARIWDPLAFVIINKITSSALGLMTGAAEFKITSKVLEDVKAHIVRFGPKAENEVMVERMNKIANGELTATEVDLNYAKHELRESELMKSGMEYNEAHEAVLKEQNMFHRGYEKKLYTEEAIKAGNAQIERETLNPNR